ncbi:MAG: hypothetical protein R3C44_14175 [Chloroflexota bacterium]
MTATVIITSSQAWIKSGYIDSISPMIYPGTYNCPDDSFWSQSRWETLVADFRQTAAGSMWFGNRHRLLFFLTRLRRGLRRRGP